MSNSSRAVFFIVTLAVWLAAGAARASVSDVPSGVDVKDVFCGLGHNNVSDQVALPLGAEEFQLGFIGSASDFQSALSTLKCKLSGHHGAADSNSHVCPHAMRCTDPIQPASSTGFLLSWCLAPSVAFFEHYHPTPVSVISNTPLSLHLHYSPEPRPPASVTV